MTLAKDLRPGQLIDLEPAFRAFAIENEEEELAERVHWSIYEMAEVETVHADPLTPGHVVIEHNYGLFSLPADFDVRVDDGV